MSRESVDENVELLREAEEWDRRIVKQDPESLEAFARWIRATPSNLKAYLAHVMIETELEGLDCARQVDLESLLVEALRPR